jgi:acetyl esterase/lipase
VVLIHGGFWRARPGKDVMEGLAKAVTAEGWAAWNIEFRRLGRFGGGGGWPATFVDVSAALDHLRKLDGVDPGRVVTCGHAAGGHLALWLAGRHRLPAGAPGGLGRVRVRGAVALAGVVDLRRAAELGVGDGAVAAFLGGEPKRLADRYDQASPAELLPLGVPQVLIHGLGDKTVPPALSEQYAARARAKGDAARFIPIPGAGHADLITARGPAWDATLPALRELLSG